MYELILSDTTIYRKRDADFELELGSQDSKRSDQLLKQIDQQVGRSEGKRDEKSTRETINTIGLKEPGKLYNPSEAEQFVTVITYAFAAAGATAVFVRKVLGAAKDWRDLSKGRSIKVRFGKKEVDIKEGDDIEQVLGRLKALQAAEGRRRNPARGRNYN
jgi:hypothetical protein